MRGFPHWGLWQQRNAGFGRDVVAWLAEGTPGMLTAVAGRLTGSAALFDADWDAGLPGNLAAGKRAGIDWRVGSGGVLRVIVGVFRLSMHVLCTVLFVLCCAECRPPPCLRHQQRDGAGTTVVGRNRSRGG